MIIIIIIIITITIIIIIIIIMIIIKIMIIMTIITNNWIIKLSLFDISNVYFSNKLSVK